MVTKSGCIQDGYFEEETIPFSQISNYAIDDENLSSKAMGLYARIHRYITIPGFKLRKSFLLNKYKEGLRAFNSAWDELKALGYLKQKRIRTENGFIYVYKLCMQPDLDTPATVNVRMDGTVAENYDENQTTFDDIEKSEENKKQNKVCLDIEVEDDKTNEITNTEINIVTKKIKKQICYEKYKSDDNPHIDNLLNLMVEVATTKNPSIKVGKEKLSTADFKKQCSKIDSLCIEDILRSLKKYEKPIKNPRAFLLKALYNAPKTAYTRQFNEDKFTSSGQSNNSKEKITYEN